MRRRRLTKTDIESSQYSRLFPPGTLVEIQRTGFDGVATTIRGRAFARQGEVCVKLTGYTGAFPVSAINTIN